MKNEQTKPFSIKYEPKHNEQSNADSWPYNFAYFTFALAFYQLGLYCHSIEQNFVGYFRKVTFDAFFGR